MKARKKKLEIEIKVVRQTVCAREKLCSVMYKLCENMKYALHPLVGSVALVVVLLIAAVTMFVVNASSQSATVATHSFADASIYAYEGTELSDKSAATVATYSFADVPIYAYVETELSDMNIEQLNKVNRLANEYSGVGKENMQFSMSDMTDIEYGTTDERVAILQCRLDELGYLNIDEFTQYFGPATRQSIKAFQRQHAFAQSGIADTRTLEVLFSFNAKEYELSEGTSGDDVAELQEQLREMAYLETASTGYYGELTTASIKDFQKRNSLTVTGVADKVTIDLLYMPDAVPSKHYAEQERRRVKIKTFVGIAKSQVGKRYVSGATGTSSYDCSGLVYYSLKQAGSNRRRLSAQGYCQVSDWEKIASMNNLQIGDLLFFKNSAYASRVGHVGVYIGGGYMTDASSSLGRVVIRSCTTAHWRKLFVCARRPW